MAAARAIEADLVGVNLLPTPDGGHVVIELNGAVEFNQQYVLTALLRDQVAAVA